MNTTANLSREDFELWHHTFYAPHDWADADGEPVETTLALSWTELGATALATAHIPTDDVDELWRTIAEHGATSKIWVGVAPRERPAMEAFIEAKLEAKGQTSRRARANAWRWSRGGKAECGRIPAVWLDLDFASYDDDGNRDDHHKSAGLPTQADVDRTLELFPLGRPTMLIHTGGGYHAWWALAELLEDAAADQMVLDRVKTWLEERSQVTGHHYDTGVIERGRVLRPAGTLVGKGDDVSAVRIVEHNPAARYTLDDFDTFPAAASETAYRGATGVAADLLADPGSAKYLERPPLPDDINEWPPSDRLSFELPVSRVLVEAFGCRRRGDRWVYPREDGTYSSSDTHLITSLGITYRDGSQPDVEDGVERVHAFGERAAAAIGSAGKPMRTYDVVREVLCGGDPSLAGQLCWVYLERHDELIELMKTRPSVLDLHRLVQAEPERRKAARRARLAEQAAAFNAANIYAEPEPPAPTDAPLPLRERLLAQAAAVNAGALANASLT